MVGLFKQNTVFPGPHLDDKITQIKLIQNWHENLISEINGCLCCVLLAKPPNENLTNSMNLTENRDFQTLSGCGINLKKNSRLSVSCLIDIHTQCYHQHKQPHLFQCTSKKKKKPLVRGALSIFNWTFLPWKQFSGNCYVHQPWKTAHLFTRMVFIIYENH